MAKEWWKSRSNEQTIEDLVTMGVLHNKELVGWRALEGERYPDPQPGEIVVFEDFFKRGIGVPTHPFLQGLCLYYKIGICNLHPNSILLVATFIHLCEAYGALVGSPGVLELERHGHVAVGAKRCDKRCLDLIVLFESDLVITRVAIEKRKAARNRWLNL